LDGDNPPDTFEITPVDLGINILKFPRYFYAFNPLQSQDPDSDTNILLNQDVIRALQNYFENVTSAYRDALSLQIYLSLSQFAGETSNGGLADDGQTILRGDPFTYDLTIGQVAAPSNNGDTFITVYPIAGTDLAKLAALEIIQKYWRNEETPYLVGWEITWLSYYWNPQYLNPGGYIEDPMVEAIPQLPVDFWGAASQQPSDSLDFTTPTNTIFDFLPVYNPQCYSSDGTANGKSTISWLRKADRVDQTQRTWSKIYRSWIGSPIGHFDQDLFNQFPRPGNNNPDTNYGYNVPSAPSLRAADISAAAIATMTLVTNP
jgi:hypothetical protein